MARASRLATICDEVARHLDSPHVTVALSGGADSAVLAWAAVESGTPTAACFADHHLEHSERLGEAAAAIAARLGIEYAVVDATVADGPSLEARARDARYAALERSVPRGLLATGHTADDQAETILGNLLRGAGTPGLAGIPRRRGRWVRPLLGLRRTDVRAAADELELPYWDDPGNVDPRHRRNVLRQVLPDLSDRFNPDLVAALCRTAELLRNDDDALSGEAAAVPVIDDDSAILVPAPVLATLPAAVATRVVRRALRRAHPPYPGGAADVAVVMDVALGRRTAGEVSGGLRVETEGPMVAIHRSGTGDLPAPVTISVPGTADFGRWRLVAESAAAVPSTRVRHRWQELVPSGLDLTVRTAEAGERIDIGTGSKPVREALAEMGVAVRLRPGWPVVDAGGRIAWLVGGRRAAWAQPSTATAVQLTAERNPS